MVYELRTRPQLYACTGIGNKGALLLAGIGNITKAREIVFATKSSGDLFVAVQELALDRPDFTSLAARKGNLQVAGIGTCASLGRSGLGCGGRRLRGGWTRGRGRRGGRRIGGHVTGRTIDTERNAHRHGTGIRTIAIDSFTSGNAECLACIVKVVEGKHCSSRHESVLVDHGLAGLGKGNEHFILVLLSATIESCRKIVLNRVVADIKQNRKRLVGLANVGQASQGHLAGRIGP